MVLRGGSDRPGPLHDGLLSRDGVECRNRDLGLVGACGRWGPTSPFRPLDVTVLISVQDALKSAIMRRVKRHPRDRADCHIRDPEDGATLQSVERLAAGRQDVQAALSRED